MESRYRPLSESPPTDSSTTSSTTASPVSQLTSDISPAIGWVHHHSVPTPVMPFEGYGKAYVPFQNLHELYTPASGLACGTVFPELDQPYQPRSRESQVSQRPPAPRPAPTARETLLEQLAAADMMALDIGLYLNTHPQDVNALHIHRQSTQTAKALRDQYEQQYGPLRSSTTTGSHHWQWIKDPWPWQIEANYHLRGEA